MSSTNPHRGLCSRMCGSMHKHTHTHTSHYRIEGLFPAEQEILENKAWLNEYLNAVASICYTDLQSMKEKGQRCFPPGYQIMDFYVKQYHKSLVKVVSFEEDCTFCLSTCSLLTVNHEVSRNCSLFIGNFNIVCFGTSFV